MKVWQRIALAAVLVAALGLSGCQSTPKSTAQSDQADGQQQDQGQPPTMQGVTGIVTDISDTSITIAVMPEGQGFGGQNGARGSARPDGGPNGSARPDSRPDSSAQPDQRQQPDESSSPAIDTSNWEKKTFTIDSSTKITQMSRGNGNDASSQSTSLKASDIKTGESVNITERSAKAGAADAITVMGRGGFGGQGGRGDQGNPGEGQNSGNPGGEAPASSSKV